MAGTHRRCVLLFARNAWAEAAAKGLRGAEVLFTRTAQRVRDAVDLFPDVDLVVVGAAPGAGAATVLPQRGHTLGARLTAAVEDVFALGYEEVVAVGLDSPGLVADHLRAAWRALRSKNAVLGPCPDGGVYLVGLQRVNAHVVPAIPWGTDRVYRTLARLLPGAGVLGPLLDVDCPGDLRRAARPERPHRSRRPRHRDVLLRALAAPRVSAPRLQVVVRPGGRDAERLPDSRAPPMS